MKFSTKITIVLVFAASLPVLVAGYGISLLNMATLRQNAQDYYILAAERVQERVNNHIQEKAQVLGNVANVLSGAALDERAAMQQTAMQVVKQLVAEANTIDAIGVYDLAGNLADAIVKQRGSLMPPRLQVNESVVLTNASLTILDPVFFDNAKMPTVPIVVPLVAEARRIGYAVALVKTEDLCDISEAASRRMFDGKPDRISLVTDSLVLLSSNNRNAVQRGQRLPLTMPLLANSQASSQAAFVGTIQEYTVERASDEKVRTPMLGIALSVPLLRCIVLVEEPQATAYRSITALRWNIFWWTLSSAVFAAFLGLILAKQLSQPIQELSEAASKLAARDFSVMLPARRNDEFRQLYEQHNTLTQELAKFETLNIREIIAERNKLETVVRQARDGILLVDGEQRVIMANAVFAGWFGVDASSEDLLLGNAFSGDTPSNTLSDTQDISTVIAAMLTSEESTRPVEFSLKKSGEVRELVLRGNIVKIMNDGELLALLTLLRDVTSEVETDRMKTELVAIVAHELRSPLNSINGLAELIGEGVLPKEEAEEFGRTIATQSKKLAGIISKFLDLNRMESGKAEIRRIPVRVDEIVRSVIAINGAMAQKSNITVETKLPATTPPVVGDPDLLGQAVLNLFTNAVKYSPPETTVTIEIRLKADEIVITVRDEGFGISESSMPKLFTKFYRAVEDERIRTRAGTGLGLAFVKEIVQQHGGTVGVESRLNQGSTFWFSIPL